MRYVPVVAILLAIVAVMGGMGGGKPAHAMGNIVLVIGAFVLLALLFGLVLNRTL